MGKWKLDWWHLGVALAKRWIAIQWMVPLDLEVKAWKKDLQEWMDEQHIKSTRRDEKGDLVTGGGA